MRIRAFTNLVAAVALSGVSAACGIILQGREQELRISTVPSGAVATIDGRGVETPADITIPRRASRSLVRIQKEGFYSACQFLEWKSDPLLVTLDSIPAAVPLLIDVGFRAFPGQNKDISIPLEPIPPGYVDALPPDDEIIDALENRGIDICNPPPEAVPWMRLRSRFGAKTNKVIAIEGQPTRAYEILGQVDAHARGANWWTFNLWRVGGFGSFGYKSYRYKESHAGMNELLKLKALELFDEKVDALIEIQYEDLPGYDVSATGIAVRFTDTADSARAQSIEARLVELKRLLSAGVISRNEYESRRRQILNGL